MRDKVDAFFVGVGDATPRRRWSDAWLNQPSLRWFCEFVGYTIGAAAGLGVDAGLLVLLVDGLNLPVLVSTAISFTAGALVVYAISVRIAFRRHQLRNRSLELAMFVAVGGIGLLVTLVVMAGGTQWLQLDYRLCKVAAAGCSFLFNYGARKVLLF